MEITEIYRGKEIKLMFYIDQTNTDRKEMLMCSVNNTWIVNEMFYGTKREVEYIIQKLKEMIDELKELGFR